MSRNEMDRSRQERGKTYNKLSLLCVSVRHCCGYPEGGARPVSMPVPRLFIFLLLQQHCNIIAMLTPTQPWLIDSELIRACRLVMTSWYTDREGSEKMSLIRSFQCWNTDNMHYCMPNATSHSLMSAIKNGIDSVYVKINFWQGEG